MQNIGTYFIYKPGIFQFLTASNVMHSCPQILLQNQVAVALCFAFWSHNHYTDVYQCLQFIKMSITVFFRSFCNVVVL